MAITVTTASGNGTTATITAPASNSGDELVYCLVKDSNDSTTTPPTDFTYQAGLSHAMGTTNEMRVSTKTSTGGGEPGSYAVSWSGTEQWVILCAVITSTTGIDVSSGVVSSGNSMSEDVPSVTVTNASSEAVLFGGSEHAATVISAAGWATEATVSAGSTTTGAYGRAFSQTFAAGATGAQTITQTENQELGGSLIVYTPDGAEPPVVFTPRMMIF